ncbi:hypothetical protein P7I94_15575 [Pseudomonas aeruginosa]|uniref:hypothetical protein n=1 Tax=Pseudomonas aeruginosa TaxID=287 RepID=UPI00249AF40B|nr:hypothetical protein [Pseudomonas aeruginosa]EIW4156731.1 hypothetical protein [Pseudomonas aeruginosa]WGX51892.1 hypothetical protein P7I94_15575 [Pseudomonas aeruginosa]
MTCILVAHLGDEVIIAAGKRVTQITEHGARIPCGDNEEKIVRTEVGIITGAGSLAMLDPVKSLVRDHGFGSPDEVLELILQARASFAQVHADSPRLAADLTETSWMFTYPTLVNDQPVTRFVYFHQHHSAESLCRLTEGRVMCFPGGFSLAQAQALQARLQAVVTEALESLPANQVKQSVVSSMLTLMSETAAISGTVSSTCDVALVNGRDVDIASGVSEGDEILEFIPMPRLAAQ